MTSKEYLEKLKELKTFTDELQHHDPCHLPPTYDKCFCGLDEVEKMVQKLIKEVKV